MVFKARNTAVSQVNLLGAVLLPSWPIWIFWALIGLTLTVECDASVSTTQAGYALGTPSPDLAFLRARPRSALKQLSREWRASCLE